MVKEKRPKPDRTRRKRPVAARRKANAVDAAFERALAEFFVSPDDPDGRQAVAAEIHSPMAERAGHQALHEYLSFRLGEELFAVSILYIREIIKPLIITEVPRTAKVILGVLSLRGTIVPVVDLRLLLGMAETPQTRKARVLIVGANDELVGLLVDEVRLVIRLREEDIEPPPAVFGRAEMEHMQGVGRFDGEMYTLVDLQSIVDLKRFIQKMPGGRLR